MNFEQHRFSLKPILFLLAALIVISFFINASLALIPSVPATAPDSVFSAERAKSVLKYLLKEEVPHPVDSAANQIVENRLIEKIKQLGYQEELQQTTECRDYPVGIARCTQVRNIIVKIAGSDPDADERNAILLAAHYDSVGAGPGASDDGAGVATLLEILRIMSTQDRPKNTLVFLFNEGEEFGLFGAQAFMNQHPLAKTLKLAINIEARGSDGQSVMFETGEKSGWLVKEYIASTPKPLSSSLFYEVYKLLPNDTDLTVFKEHGLQGLNFAHAESEPHYHTPLDNLANLPLGTLQHHGENVWGVVQRIKDKDLDHLQEANIVYTDILGQFMLKWQEPSSLIASIVFFLLFIFVARNLSKQALLDGKSISRGVIVFFSLLLVLSTGALLLQKLAQIISEGNEPWRINNLPMQIALWSGLTLLGSLIGGWLVKKSDPLNILLGLLLCWVVLAIATSVFMVGISFLFIIPCFFTIIALLLKPIIDGIQQANSVAIIAIFSSMSVGVIFLPVVYVLEIMVSYKMSLAIGLIFSFVVGSMTPLLVLKTECNSNKRSLNYALTLLLIIGFSWTVMQPLYTPEVPQALNIIHLQKQNGKSFIAAGTKTNPTIGELDHLIHQGDDTQFSRAVEWSNVVTQNKPVKNLSLSKPETQIISTEVVDGNKVVTLQVAAYDNRFRDLYFYLKKDSRLTTIEYKGRKLDFTNEKAYRNGYYEFQCKGLTCQQTRITFTFSGNYRGSLLVVKSLSGLPSSERIYPQARGNLSVPRQFGDQTLVVSEVNI